MNSRLRLVRGWCVCMLSAILLAGCQSGSGTGAKPFPNAGGGDSALQEPANGRISVLTNRLDLIENGVFDGYAKRFAEQHPGAVVTFEGLNNYVSDVTVRLSTRTTGDVLLLPDNITNKDLDSFYEPLDPAMFAHMRFADFKSYAGKRYGLATGATTEGIVYNKKAFARAGITEVPTTLDAFYEACRKLKAAGIVPVYLNYGAQWPLKEWGETLVSYMTGKPDALNEMVEADNPWRMDNEWGQALDIVRTLVSKQYVEPNILGNDWEASKAKLASGEAAMYFLGNWVINQIIDAGGKSGDIGFFPFPYDNEPSRRYAPLNPDWFIGISKFSENKALAKAWVEFFVKDSGYIDESGFLPVDTEKQSMLPQYREFLSFRPTLVESKAPSDAFLEIANKAEIAFWSGDFIQKLIVAPSLEEGFDELNRRWKEARRLVLP